MKKHRLLQITAGVLCFFMLLSGTGCSYAILGCSAMSCNSCLPQEVKEQITDTISELSEMAAQNSDEKPEAKAYTKDPGSDAANTAFLSLDRELFTWYITTDIITFDQFCYDPNNIGIDERSVPVTLGELTETAQKDWITSCKNWLNRLKTLDSDHLGEQYRLAYDNYIRYFETEIAYEDLFYYYEPLEQYTGIHLRIPLTFGLYELRNVTDVENYLSLLADMPRYFQQVLEFEKQKASFGLFMPESMLDAVLGDMDRIMEAGSSSELGSAFQETLDSADWLSQEQKTAFRTRNDELVKTCYLVAYRSLRDGLEALRPYCRKSVGAKDLDEKALRYFTLRFQEESATTMSVGDALDLLSQMSGKLYELLTQAYRNASGNAKTPTTGTMQGDERYLRTLITGFLPQLPNTSVTYRTVPEELREGFSPAAFVIPAMDHYTDNTILINPKEDANILTLAHEGFPGHLFQYVYQYGLGKIPLFQMTIEPLGYAEGWAKNAEYAVAQRADMFGTADLCATTLNRLLTDLIVARCALMINGTGSTKEEITQFLRQWGLDSHTDEIMEIAVNMPTYYFKYVMGFCRQYMILETCRSMFALREKDFYAEYLSWGPSYFDLLEPKLLAWAEANRNEQ